MEIVKGTQALIIDFVEINLKNLGLLILLDTDVSLASLD